MEARTGSRDGAGLGLSITRSAATAHGAVLTVSGQPAGGLAVRVVIPHYNAAGRRADPRRPGERAVP
jgi:signal transduction histidine kinase